MNNLETYDPQLAQKLERKQRNKITLWVMSKEQTAWEKCETIGDARKAWHVAKLSGKWSNWELYNNGEIKKGVF